jgi:hypothetical protein
MKLKIAFPLLFVALLILSNVQAQQTAKMTSSGIGFLQYLPDGYNSNTNKYPIVISLHGIKEKGNTLTDVNKVANVGLPKYVKLGTKYSFILISPQLKTNMGRWTGDYVIQVLNYVKSTLRVDPNRIYLTGLSLGGGGVQSVATAYPEVWASILPICSGYNVVSSAGKIASADLPTWGFHGDADAVVGEAVTINMINAINNYKPSPLAKVTIFPNLGHVIWDRVYKDTNALDWMLSFRKGSTTPTPSPTPSNVAPVAKAGGDKKLTLPSNATTINGSATDSDGTIASYAWVKKSGGAASISGANTKDLKLSGLVAGTYVFSLTVKDNKGASDSDDVNVVVSKSTTNNAAPVAYAGSDKVYTLPRSSIAVTGTGKDSDGTIASYKWVKTYGGTITMSGTNTATLTLSSLKKGSYIFGFTVTDNNGGTHTDYMKVTVESAPVANAGSDKTVRLPVSSLALRGSATDNGTISSYTWTKSSGPSVSMTNAKTKTVTLKSLHAGTYVFKLAVKDNKGLSDQDFVQVVVKGAVASVQSFADDDDMRVASLDMESADQIGLN